MKMTEDRIIHARKEGGIMAVEWELAGQASYKRTLYGWQRYNGVCRPVTDDVSNKLDKALDEVNGLKILRGLRRNPGGIPLVAVAFHATVDTTTAQRLLDSLVKRGSVIINKGKYAAKN